MKFQMRPLYVRLYSFTVKNDRDFVSELACAQSIAVGSMQLTVNSKYIYMYQTCGRKQCTISGPEVINFSHAQPS